MKGDCFGKDPRNDTGRGLSDNAIAFAMTRTMRFDGTLQAVIASEAKQSFSHK